MNKKGFALVMILTLILFVSCGETQSTAIQASPELEQTVKPTAEPTVEPSDEPTPEPSEEPEPEVSTVAYDDPRDADWLEDIAYFREEMLDQHPKLRDLEYYIDWKVDLLEKRYGTAEDNRVAFNRQVDILVSEIPELSDLQMLFRLQEITASLEDFHTFVNVYEAASDETYPFAIIDFEGEFYVYRIYKGLGLENVLGCRVVAINSIGISDIFTRFLKIKSTDEGNVHAPIVAMFYDLVFADALKYLGVVQEDGAATYTMMSDDGKTFDITVSPNVSQMYYESDEWAYVERVGEVRHMSKRADEPHFLEYIEEDDILHFRYRNALTSTYDKEFANLAAEAQEILTNQKPKKLLFDLRGNGGGYYQTDTINTFCEFLAEHMSNNECEVFVAIDNRVSSAAVSTASQLARRTGATLIGTPTGEPPVFYASPRTFSLPNSGISVDYSYILGIEEQDELAYPTNALLPDIYVADTFEDYVNQYDRLYEMVKSY